MSTESNGSQFPLYFSGRIALLSIDACEAPEELNHHALAIGSGFDAVMRCVRLAAELSEAELDCYPPGMVADALCGAEVLSSLAKAFMITADGREAAKRLKKEARNG